MGTTECQSVDECLKMCVCVFFMLEMCLSAGLGVCPEAEEGNRNSTGRVTMVPYDMDVSGEGSAVWHGWVYASLSYLLI